MDQRSDDEEEEELEEELQEEDITWESNALHEASKNGDVEGVRELLKTQSELVNSRDENGWTALHVSTYLTPNG